MLNLRLLRVLILPTLMLLSFKTYAIQSFLDRWQTFYPNSSSGDVRCQLCHLNRDGGSPWNSYGRDLRNEFQKLDPLTREIEDAFRKVEAFNSDQDGAGINNLSEINANQQPGWREGRVNTVYDRDDVPSGPFNPPLTIDPFPAKIPSRQSDIELVEVAEGFTSPLAMVTAPLPSLSEQTFVVDQVGIVWRVDLNSGDKTEYLNLSSRLITLGAFSPGGYDERGLLGFAFHPRFASNGRVYAYLSQPVAGVANFTTLTPSETADHQSVLIELTIGNPTAISGAATVASERELMRLDQPQFNHNGGDLQFDRNGLLYIGIGDGGGADDQGVGHGTDGNGSDPSNPFGAILRIDPLGSSPRNSEYGIPATNPFTARSDRLDEIYAFGFRNPWKLSFDTDGQLFVADVGQNDVEEINRVDAGMHYGWRFREGRFFFDPNGDLSGLITQEFPDNLPPEFLIDPILQYDHDEGISISGGHVYRGQANRLLRGRFIFADFLKRIFVGDINTGNIQALDLNPDIFIYSLGRDASNELYIMGNATAETSGSSGKIYKLVSTLPPQEDELCVPIKTKTGGVAVICL